MDLGAVLKRAVEQGASDVHLVVGRPPLMRQNGDIKPVDAAFSPLEAEAMRAMIYAMLLDEQRARFEASWDLDCSFAVPGLSRFRVNVLRTQNGVEAVMRVISARVPDPESLAISPALLDLAELPRGMVLVVGPTGSGKSTTLACLIEHANQRRACNIITIEDPVEFVYESKKAIIRQREVGQNTKSFLAALKACLREDPNIVLVGEMRDYETMGLAVTAAETGHLCFATLHTQDAPSTIARIIDVFPANQQTQIRVQLAESLKAVIAQLLLPRRDGKGRVAVREVMVVTPAIANLIREGKTHMIYSAIETGAQFGMISMDKALAETIKRGLVDPEVALTKAHNVEQVRSMAGLRGPGGAGLR